MPYAALQWLLARCCTAVASCPRLCGRCYLPDAARRWLLARCCAAVASCPMAQCCAAVATCPMLRGSSFLPYAALQWLRYHLSSNVLRTDSEGWRVSKFRKCRARCGESRTDVDKCSELALVVEEVLLQWGNVEERMQDDWPLGCRALGCCPGGTLPSGHARRYSS